MQVTIQGFDELRRRLSDPQIRGFAEDAMEQACALVVYGVKKYPPRPPWSTYQRTGHLLDSWDHQVKWNGRELIGTVLSEAAKAPYGPYVQGEQQTWFHKRTGWRTLPDAAKQEMKAIEAFFTDALKRMRDYMAGG